MEQMPSKVLLDVLKSLGVSNLQAGRVLFSSKPLANDDVPSERVDYWYIRRRMHVSPGLVNERLYADYWVSTGRLYDMIRSRAVVADDLALSSYLSDGVRDQMCAGLLLVGQEEHVYSNACDRLVTMSLSEDDRARLLLLLLVATGCSQNGRRGAEEVKRRLEELSPEALGDDGDTDSTGSLDRAGVEGSLSENRFGGGLSRASVFFGWWAARLCPLCTS